MEILLYAVSAAMGALIYRQGLKDGQRASAGEQIPSRPFRLPKKHKETEVEKGLRNIINYGVGGAGSAKK